MSNESKQSSPIGDVEQAAKDYAEKENSILPEHEYYELGEDEPYYDYSTRNFLIQSAIKRAFIAGSQWASPRWVKASDGSFPKKDGWYHLRKNAPVYNRHWAAYIVVIAIDTELWKSEKWEWLDETAHPTAVNGDDAELTEIRNKLYDSIPSGKLDAWELITAISNHLKELDKYIDQPKAAAPKADVKEYVEKLYPTKGDLSDPDRELHDWALNKIYQAKFLEGFNYANQFKSPQASKTNNI